MAKNKYKVLILVMLGIFFTGCQMKQEEEKLEEEEVIEEIPVEDVRVSLLSTGDNLIHGAVFSCPSNLMEDGTWNFDANYEPVKEIVEGADLANINQETILGGRELGLSHYPCFNSPQEIGTSLVNTGFDWISQATNHSLDKGEAAILSAMDFWDQYPDVVTTGINRSEEEAAELRIIERKGIRFGLLNYTYGTNGIEEPEGKEYLVNNIDKEQIKADIDALKPHCDVMLASMHWGIEYATTVSDEQRELAQFLADEGVLVIFGSHPHVIEPAEYITGKDGNKTLVIYSMGNFLSAQDQPINMLGALVTCDVVKDGKTNEFYVDNAKFYPTVTYMQQGFVSFRTYLLKDYTDEIAQTHDLAPYVNRDYFIEQTKEIVGVPEGIEVVYE